MDQKPDYEAAFTRGANYEAGFTRTADIDEPAPEEVAARRKGKSRLVKGGIAVAVIAALAGAGGAVFALRRDTPDKQVERGIAFSASNSHVAAVIEFKRSLQEDPNQPSVRLLLGKELSLLNDPSAAEIEFSKVVDAKYKLDKALPLLATSLLHQAKFEKLIALVNGTTVDSPDANAELLSLRGSAYFALGRETEAQDSWKAARDFVPGNPSTVMAEARALASKGSFDEAVKILGTINGDTPMVELLSLKGELAHATGKPLEAVADYQAALKIEPGNLFLRESLARTLIELSRFDEASDQVKRILLPLPKYGNAHYLAAQIAVGKNELLKANDEATTAVALTPTDGRFQLLAGKIALQLKHPADAEQHLRDAVTALPQNAEARTLLAILYASKNAPTKAEDLFQPVFESNRNNRYIATIAARIASLQGNATKAATAFDQVDASDPKNVYANLLAASYKINAGDKVGGIARLRAASAASPDNPDVDAALVMSYLTFADVKEAVAAWNVLAKKQPTAPRTYNLRGALDLARNDKAGAKRSLQQAADADPAYLSPVSGLAMIDIKDQKPDDAKARLKRFIAANPANAEAILALVGLEKAYGNRPDVILGELMDGLKANPKSPELTGALVGYYAERGDPKQALEFAEKGLAFAPDDVRLLQYVGEQAFGSGNNDRAITIFRRLMDLNASSPDAPMRLGQALLADGKSEEALTAFRQSLNRDPYNQDRQLALVSILVGAGKADEAARMEFEVGRVAPKSPVLPELDADVKLALKQYPEAIAAYRRALAQTPSSRLVIKTFNGLMTARLRGEANTFLTDWLKAHPNDDQVRYFDGEQALRVKDYARATHDFRQLATAHPNDPMVLNNLAWSLSRQNDPQALAIAEKAVALAPNNASASDTLGFLLVEQGDADRGLSLIEKASRALPNELEIRIHLAQAQLKKGRRDDARTTLQSVVASAPQSDEAKKSRDLLATF